MTTAQGKKVFNDEIQPLNSLTRCGTIDITGLKNTAFEKTLSVLTLIRDAFVQTWDSLQNDAEQICRILLHFCTFIDLETVAQCTQPTHLLTIQGLRKNINDWKSS